MGFYQLLTTYQEVTGSDYFSSVKKRDIETILQKHSLQPLDFLALLSPTAEEYLEAMAQKAHRLTIQHFGKTILMYTPLYLSNYCTNQCVYCGFATHSGSKRKQLTAEEVRQEAQAIAAAGFKHLLILTGDAPKIASVEYLEECIGILRSFFPSIGLEVYALSTEEYARLIQAGADLLTMYQETYNPLLYDRLHIKGPKKDYHFRLDAPERACLAGIRSVNIGALLGLDEDWRREAFFTGLHAHYLQNKYSQVEINISLPRLRPHFGNHQPLCTVTDKNIVQYMLAFRLFMPWSGITISTRERAEFRDRLLPLGVTKMSAGSCTAVGGHSQSEQTEGQFSVSDERDLPQMCLALRSHGYQPVFKNWEPL